MADGCNLFLSEEDFKQILDSRLNQKQIGEVVEYVNTVMESSTKAMAEKVTYPLSNPKHPAHKVLSTFVLRNVAGNKSIPESYKQKLPKAVADIAKINPTVLGLVKPARNWGQTTPIDSAGKLGHKTKGAGFAYELLGTAALINRESKAKNTGVNLKIHATDRPDLGIKFQDSYLFTERVLPFQTDRRSIEGDLVIWPPIDSLRAPIAVDFKHSLNAGEYSGGIANSQIERIRQSLMTDVIHEFHFVTNGIFSKNDTKAINTANQELQEAGHRGGLISCHENVKYGNM